MSKPIWKDPNTLYFPPGSYGLADLVEAMNNKPEPTPNALTPAEIEELVNAATGSYRARSSSLTVDRLTTPTLSMFMRMKKQRESVKIQRGQFEEWQ